MVTFAGDAGHGRQRRRDGLPGHGDQDHVGRRSVTAVTSQRDDLVPGLRPDTGQAAADPGPDPP
jgi:hypothetical protein